MTAPQQRRPQDRRQCPPRQPLPRVVVLNPVAYAEYRRKGWEIPYVRVVRGSEGG